MVLTHKSNLAACMYEAEDAENGDGIVFRARL